MGVCHSEHLACCLQATNPGVSTYRRYSLRKWWGNGGLNSKFTQVQPSVKSTTYGVSLVKVIIGANQPVRATVPKAAIGTAKPSSQRVLVDENSDGQRLDNFLMRTLKGVPKTHVYRIIRSGEVRINRGRVSADTRVKAGDWVRLPPVRVAAGADPKSDAPVPAREFEVLFEDEHLMAINKPAGVAVHGGSGVSFGVIEQLRRARPESRFLELVHRLDRETSGILLVAKKRSALTKLQDQFRERETGKTYLALVQGKWPDSCKVIDAPLHKYVVKGQEGESGAGERRVKVVAKDDPNGMRSVTLVKVARRWNAFSLLEVTIKTGRTHQIRVHLAFAGHRIAGDDKYGDFDWNRALQKQGLKRMFLHAWRLQFNHPANAERITLCADLPSELEFFLAQIPPAPV